MGSKNSTTKTSVLPSEPLFLISLKRVTGMMLQSQFKKSVYTSLFTRNAEQSPKSTPRTEVCTRGVGQETPSRCEIQINSIQFKSSILDFISSLKMHSLWPPMAWCLPNPFPSLLRQNTNSSPNRHSRSRDSLRGSKFGDVPELLQIWMTIKPLFSYGSFSFFLSFKKF